MQAFNTVPTRCQTLLGYQHQKDVASVSKRTKVLAAAKERVAILGTANCQTKLLEALAISMSK